MTKVKPFPEKVRQSVKIYFDQNLGIRTFSKNGFGATLSSKPNILGFQKGIFQLFASFSVTKVRPFPQKVRQSVKIYFNKNFGIRTFSENGFGATFNSKPNVVSVLKEHFLVFCKFLTHECESIS